VPTSSKQCTTRTTWPTVSTLTAAGAILSTSSA
jgi:hypothetical protein